jgi:hypothetical protein
MQGHAPSVEFLAAVCMSMGISAEWLLTGRGPMRVGELRQHALKEANPGELLTAVANTLQQLQERVERLEIFVQTLEARLRVGAARGENNGELKIDGHSSPAHHGAIRARSIADAVAARPRQDAR